MQKESDFSCVALEVSTKLTRALARSQAGSESDDFKHDLGTDLANGPILLVGKLSLRG